MRLRFTPIKMSAAAASAVAAILFLGWAEPLAMSQDKPENSAKTAEEAPVEEATAEGTSSEKPEDLEVIDLNESLDEQSEKWDSAKTRYPSAATPVTIENIVEPSGEYHYASFGKPNPFMPPQIKVDEEMADEDMISKPASDISSIPVVSAPTVPVLPNVSAAANSTASQEIPVVSTLQKYPMARLELKGVWQLDTGDKRAIVMTPNKEGVIIKVNDPIAAGKVLEIQKDHIVVRQYRLRDDGVREFSDENLYLGDAKRKEKTFVRLLPGKEPEFTPEEAKAPTTPVPINAPMPPVAPKGPETAKVVSPAPAPVVGAPIPAAPVPAKNGPLLSPVPFGTAAPIAPTNAPTTGSSKP